MSKVLRMIDFDLLITYRHEQFLIEEGMNENITDDDKYENYINPDGDFIADDVPF